MKINFYRTIQVVLTTIFFCGNLLAQSNYKFHSHNDYAQDFPFWKAYIHGASSIEADIFLKNDELYVTHSEDEIQADFTLENLYLKPLADLAKAGKLRNLQLLIDLKSESKTSLKKLVEVLNSYPELTQSDKISFVISGNRPRPNEYKNYPDFIEFDHQDLSDLEKADLTKVALISQNFRDYSVWNGLGRITAPELKKVETAIKKAPKLHLLGTKIIDFVFI